MDSVVSVIQSPVFLGILVLLGVTSLVRVIISRDPSLKRSYRGDRRNSKTKMPETPFTDSDGVEVTKDRRVLADRRSQSLPIFQDDAQTEQLGR